MDRAQSRSTSRSSRTAARSRSATASLILGFPEDQPFLREKAEQRRSALEDGVAHVLGRPVGVRCVVANVELADSSGHR